MLFITIRSGLRHWVLQYFQRVKIGIHTRDSYLYARSAHNPSSIFRGSALPLVCRVEGRIGRRHAAAGIASPDQAADPPASTRVSVAKHKRTVLFKGLRGP